MRAGAPFLLLRRQKLPAVVFICPYNDETIYSADPTSDPQVRSNFTDYRTNLSYSFANAYPSASAEATLRQFQVSLYRR